ncbi:MAG: hypothetical protein ULS35scaffold63_61 [Phage 33_17]|nr:MAG: hypothetical protein ULS35scaffold63_61 [Phage 33_17]
MVWRFGDGEINMNNLDNLRRCYYRLFDKKIEICKNIANLYLDWEKPIPDISEEHRKFYDEIDDFLISIENDEIPLNSNTINILNILINKLDFYFCILQDNQSDKIREENLLT